MTSAVFYLVDERHVDREEKHTATERDPVEAFSHNEREGVVSSQVRGF